MDTIHYGVFVPVETFKGLAERLTDLGFGAAGDGFDVWAEQHYDHGGAFHVTFPVEGGVDMGTVRDGYRLLLDTVHGHGTVLPYAFVTDLDDWSQRVRAWHRYGGGSGFMLDADTFCCLQDDCEH